MEYVIVKTMTSEDIIGRLKMIDEQELIIEDPCYVNKKPKMNGNIHFGMMRVTLLGDKHEIILPVEKVLTYYAASENVSRYYTKVIDTYDKHYDDTFAQMLDNSINEEYDDEEETEMIKTYMERMLQANNDIH